jgi:hypothetical protein
MAHLNHDNPFQAWVLSQQEYLVGSILTLTQKQVIQNQIAQLALQKNNLTFDPTSPLVFMQAEAELRGQITALQYLLDISVSSEAQMNPGAQSVNLNSDQSSLFPQE